MNYKEIIGKAKEFCEKLIYLPMLDEQVQQGLVRHANDLLQYLETLSPESLKEDTGGIEKLQDAFCMGWNSCSTTENQFDGAERHRKFQNYLSNIQALSSPVGVEDRSINLEVAAQMEEGHSISAGDPSLPFNPVGVEPVAKITKQGFCRACSQPLGKEEAVADGYVADDWKLDRDSFLIAYQICMKNEKDIIVDPFYGESAYREQLKQYAKK